MGDGRKWAAEQEEAEAAEAALKRFTSQPAPITLAAIEGAEGELRYLVECDPALRRREREALDKALRFLHRAMGNGGG